MVQEIWSSTTSKSLCFQSRQEKIVGSWRRTFTQPSPELDVAEQREPRHLVPRVLRLRTDQEGLATKLRTLFCLTKQFFCPLAVCVELEGINTHKVTGTVYVIKIFSQFIKSLSFVSFQCLQARKRLTNLTFLVQFTTRFSGEVKRKNP